MYYFWHFWLPQKAISYETRKTPMNIETRLEERYLKQDCANPHISEGCSCAIYQTQTHSQITHRPGYSSMQGTEPAIHFKFNAARSKRIDGASQRTSDFSSTTTILKTHLLECICNIFGLPQKRQCHNVIRIKQNTNEH